MAQEKRNISYKEIKAAEDFWKAEEILTELPPFVQGYYTHMRSKSAGTVLLYLRDIQNFFSYMISSNPLLAKKEIKEITIEDMQKLTRQDVEEFLNNLINSKIIGYELPQRNSTKNVYISALTSLFTFLEDEGELPTNIMLKVRKSKKDRKRRVVRLDSEEEDALLDTILYGTGMSDKQIEFSKKTKDRDYAIVLILLRTGLRVSELVGLNIEDINFKKNSFLVARKESVLKDDEVFFDDDVLEAIELYLNGKTAANTQRGTPLFTVSQGKYKGDRLSVRSVENMVYKYTTAATGRRISPHKLRATFATNMINATGNIELVKALMGHADISTTTLYIDDESLEKEKARNILKQRKENRKDSGEDNNTVHKIEL